MEAMTITQALSTIKQHWRPNIKSEQVNLQDALGRVNVDDIYSKITLPVQRSAKIDSVVVQSKNFNNGIPDTKNWVRGKDFERADMGDDFSDQFDAAIPVEAVKFSDNEQKITFVEDVNMGIARPNFNIHELNIKPGEGINKQGSVIKQEELVVRANTTLSPINLANIALAGYTTVNVIQKPTVAFIPTGSELIPFGNVPERGQMIDTNSIMMSSFLEKWAAKPVMYPIIKDQKKALRACLEEAMKQSDIIIINGGSSKGEEDFCSQLIKEGADFFHHHFLAVPGRPASVAVHGEKLIINIPGPTLATFGVAHWLLKPLIQYYYNNTFNPTKTVKVRLLNDKVSNFDVAVCIWFKVEKLNEEYVATAYFRESKLSQVLLEANAYAFLPINNNAFKKGDYLEVNWIE